MKSKEGAITTILLIFYVLILIGVILFKLPFSLHGIESVRAINPVPLMGSFTEDGVFNLREIIENVVVFVPLGIYLCMLKKDWSFVKRLVAIVSTTLAFEVTQFIFAIGISDMTDILSNTLGGIMGIGIYALLTKVLKTKTNKAINIVALVLTGCVLLFLVYIMFRTSRMVMPVN